MALYAQQPISGNNKSTNFSSKNNYANEFFKDFNDTTYELDNEGHIILEETSPGYFKDTMDSRITTFSQESTDASASTSETPAWARDVNTVVNAGKEKGKEVLTALFAENADSSIQTTSTSGNNDEYITGVNVVSGTQQQENPIEDNFVRQRTYGPVKDVQKIVDVGDYILDTENNPHELNVSVKLSSAAQEAVSDYLMSQNDANEITNATTSENPTWVDDVNHVVGEAKEKIPKIIEDVVNQNGTNMPVAEDEVLPRNTQGYSTSTDGSSQYMSKEQVEKGIEAGRLRNLGKQLDNDFGIGEQLGTGENVSMPSSNLSTKNTVSLKDMYDKMLLNGSMSRDEYNAAVKSLPNDAPKSSNDMQSIINTGEKLATDLGDTSLRPANNITSPTESVASNVKVKTSEEMPIVKDEVLSRDTQGYSTSTDGSSQYMSKEQVEKGIKAGQARASTTVSGEKLATDLGDTSLRPANNITSPTESVASNVKVKTSEEMPIVKDELLSRHTQGYSTSTDGSSQYMSKEQVEKGIEAARDRASATISREKGVKTMDTSSYTRKISTSELANVYGILSHGSTSDAIDALESIKDTDAYGTVLASTMTDDNLKKRFQGNVHFTPYYVNNRDSALPFLNSSTISSTNDQVASPSIDGSMSDVKSKVNSVEEMWARQANFTDVSLENFDKAKINGDNDGIGLDNIQSTIGAGVLSALTTFGNFVGSLKKYDSDEVSIVKSKIQSVNGDVEEVHRSIISATGSLSFNELTQSKLPGNGVLMTGLYTLEGNWRTSVEAILSDVGASETAVANTDKNDGGSTSGKNYGTFAASAVGGSTSSSGGTKHRQVKEEKPKPTEPINTELIAASVGIVTFTEIVAMKESMDATTTVNSSESASYGLIGVTKDNNEQYYYQIIDKETGKVYYIEVNDKVKVETEVKETLKVNEDLALLKTNNTDAEDNLGKIAKQGEMYLVKSTEENADGISFAKVLDSTDGKDYYVMINDETEIISLDNLNGGEAAAGAVSEDGGIDVT